MDQFYLESLSNIDILCLLRKIKWMKIEVSTTSATNSPFSAYITVTSNVSIVNNKKCLFPTLPVNVLNVVVQWNYHNRYGLLKSRLGMPNKKRYDKYILHEASISRKVFYWKNMFALCQVILIYKRNTYLRTFVLRK